MFIRREFGFRIIFIARRIGIGLKAEAVELKRRLLLLRGNDRWWNFTWNDDVSRHWRCHAGGTDFGRRWTVVGITRATSAVFSLALDQKLHTGLDQLRPGLQKLIKKKVSVNLIAVSDFIPRKLCAWFMFTANWVFFLHFGFFSSLFDMTRIVNATHTHTIVIAKSLLTIAKKKMHMHKMG